MQMKLTCNSQKVAYSAKGYSRHRRQVSSKRSVLLNALIRFQRHAVFLSLGLNSTAKYPSFVILLRADAADEYGCNPTSLNRGGQQLDGRSY